MSDAFAFWAQFEEPQYIELPILDPSQRDTVSSMKFPYLLPHEVLAYMYSIGARTPKSHIQMYWDWGRRFNCGWARLGDASVVRVGIYGDEAKYNDGPPQEKILGIYINFVLFRPASIRHSRFLIFSMRSCFNLGPATMYPLMWKLVESMHFAYLGKFPNGEKLCDDGSRFLVTELRGDLVWHKFCWQFDTRGWQSLDVCFFCNAKSKGATDLYSDLGTNASWTNTEFKEVWDWVGKVLPHRLWSLQGRFSMQYFVVLRGWLCLRFTQQQKNNIRFCMVRSMVGPPWVCDWYGAHVHNAQCQPWHSPKNNRFVAAFQLCLVHCYVVFVYRLDCCVVFVLVLVLWCLLMS